MTQTINISYEHYTLDTLPTSDSELVKAAFEATTQAYAPFSGFKVGAAARLRSGEIITAANCESEVFPSGLCAERTTLFYAGSSHPDTPVVALAIAAYTDGAFTPTPIAPCGACRQVMLETESRHHHPIRILLYGTEGIYLIEGGTRELLPLTFDASFME